MGFCSKRHFLLTICTLQLITTSERQVFDFLGYMWVPILVNFFNIIFVILGFFGALQYRAKYIITYCVWNVLWLGWNGFVTCFYLDAAGLDKTTDLLNFGTGSFSWWLINGPGCNPYFNRTIDRPDFTRPERPQSVSGCVLNYELVEVLHASIQCLLAVIAVVAGILLSRVFMEEDDSFDFVGGGDFGMAGHTPLHPMYVSYSALPPAAATGHNNYYYPTNTTTTMASSSSGTLKNYNNNNVKNQKLPELPPPRQRRANDRASIVDYSAELPRNYDTLESHTPNLSLNRPPYSPMLRSRQLTRVQGNRNSYRPRFLHADHIRESPSSHQLRSFHSDPRLAMEDQANRSPLPRRLGIMGTSNHNDCRPGRRDARPMSMFINNY